MTDERKAKILREAMDKLEDAERLVKLALGDTDAGMLTRNSIGEAIEDLMYDIIELESTEVDN